MIPDGSGYKEIEVTADRAIEVWALSLEDIFITSAIGMYDLAGITTEGEKNFARTISLSALDNEILLVTFLEELAYIIEDESIVFTGLHIDIDGNELKAEMGGRRFVEIEHEIKAVTYNELEIKEEGGKFYVTIVFDL